MSPANAYQCSSVDKMASYFLPFGLSSWTLFAAPAIACSLLFTWRLWRFSIAPSFNPDDPEQLPYWIPFLGHAFRFSQDPQTLFVDGQKEYGRVSRPYAITVAGRTLYVLTDPQDFSNVYRNAATFTFDPLVEEVYRAFQLAEATIERLYRTPSSSHAHSGSFRPSEKDAVNVSHETIVVEMRGKSTHGHRLKAKRQLDSMIDLESICSRFSTTRDGSSTIVSLFKLCSIMVTAAGQAAYFGDALSKIDPSLPEAFVDFDKLCWQIFYRPPIFWSKQMTKCKTKLLKALETYSRKPMEQRPDMPQFLQTWEIECRKAGLCNSDIAIIMLIQYFGLNTNTPKACFWIFCHVLFNAELVQIIRNETSVAFASDTFDYDVIENSQTLHGIWLETLRLSTSSLSFRYITQDFDLKGLKLRKGNQVVLNPRLLHLDPDYFGADPLNFDAKRFVDNPGYQRHPAFRPFGGGEAQCPGRQMAKQTALTFVAYVLHEFDVDLPWPQEYPKPSHESHPGVAVMAPAESDDLFVRLTERQKDKRH